MSFSKTISCPAFLIFSYVIVIIIIIIIITIIVTTTTITTTTTTTTIIIIIIVTVIIIIITTTTTIIIIIIIIINIIIIITISIFTVTARASRGESFRLLADARLQCCSSCLCCTPRNTCLKHPSLFGVARRWIVNCELFCFVCESPTKMDFQETVNFVESLANFRRKKVELAEGDGDLDFHF